MATPENAFREKIKDVLMQKDELETQLQAAADAAKNKDDLTKLINTIKKLQKLLADMVNDMEHKSVALDGSINKAAPKKPTPPALTTAAPPALTTAAPPALTTAAPPALTQSAPPALTQSAPPALTTSAPPALTTAAPPAPAPPPVASDGGYPQQTALKSAVGGISRVFQNQSRNVPDYSQFRKNTNIPDSQRIFLPIIAQDSSEEKLYYHFANLSYPIVDIKVIYGNVTSAIIGFSTLAAVEQLLREKFYMDGQCINARPCKRKEERFGSNENSKGRSNPQAQDNRFSNGPATRVPQGLRFGVFLGGIPTRANLNDVLTVLEEYGSVRDLRMPTIRGDYGAVIHRNIAFVDFEKPDAAQRIFAAGYITVLGKEVECKPNTKKPVNEILAWPGLKGSSSSSSFGSMADLSTSLPSVPPLSNQVSGNGNTTRNAAGTGAQSGKAGTTAKGKKCVLCRERPQDCVLLWCGHTETCMQCGETVKNCPKAGCGNIVTSRIPAEAGTQS